MELILKILGVLTVIALLLLSVILHYEYCRYETKKNWVKLSINLVASILLTVVYWYTLLHYLNLSWLMLFIVWAVFLTMMSCCTIFPKVDKAKINKNHIHKEPLLDSNPTEPETMNKEILHNIRRITGDANDPDTSDEEWLHLIKKITG